MAEHIRKHTDGSIWAKGQMINDKEEGYWVYFRKDGTKMRSGHFKNGQPVGEWITYDDRGEIYKVTNKKG